MKEFREDLTDAVVIDLGRLPSHGREAGVFLRASKSTRLIPLLFVCTEGVEDDPEKVAGKWPNVRLQLDRIAAAVNAATPGSHTEVEIPHKD